jgi:glycosyltransferase involved in cell wall biosynthesis
VRVLAADEALRTTIRQILQVLGYAVEFQTRAGPEEASSLDAVRVLIVDEADAEESLLLGALQRGVKVIVTATGAGARERFAGKGTAVLLKPFSIAELAGTVRRLLDAASWAEPEQR